MSEDTMRIDAHQHFWKYDAAEYTWIDDSMAALKRDFLPDESAREMARVGFDACVAVQARQTLDETRWLLGLAAELAGRLPSQRFVLDHLAKPDLRSGEIDEWERDIRRLAAQPNVFAKLSGLVTEASWAQWTSDQIRPYLDVAFDAFGWNR